MASAHAQGHLPFMAHTGSAPSFGISKGDNTFRGNRGALDAETLSVNDPDASPRFALTRMHKGGHDEYAIRARTCAEATTKRARS